MYVPAHFELKDTVATQDFLRANVFATFAAQVGGCFRLAYGPTVFDPVPGPLGSIRFHFARANPIAELSDGDRVRVSFLGPHAYISPDRYETDGLVPTWNYVAAEGEGAVRRLSKDALRDHLEELAAQEEGKLAPKTAWKLSRVDPERLDGMLNAIAGFHLVFETLQGKAKLSQNRAPSDVDGVISGLEARGNAPSREVAAAMRQNLAKGR